MKNFFLPLLMIFLWFFGCVPDKKENGNNTLTSTNQVTSFKEEVDFLNRFTEIITLRDPSGNCKVAVSPALQGRVMTSTSGGDNGVSHGWVNHAAFLSGDTSDHINVFGGEDRFWIGPEGGQFSIYFSPGRDFTLDNWHVPRLIDLEPFHTVSVSDTVVVFAKSAQLLNYSNFVFEIGIERKVRLIRKDEMLKNLGLNSEQDLSVVAFETTNTLKNTGKTPWQKETGLLSIWILGMFNPAVTTTIIVPYREKADSLREVVNDNYFGTVPGNRLTYDTKAVYFKGDGKYRSKIGISPERATEWLGSYDASNNFLTLVRYNKPDGIQDYVNSLWKIQKEPYRGDVINAYNDGPPSEGAKPLGPFYELETSSPAAALKPDESLTHVHTTYHIHGSVEQLNPIMFKFLGITTKEATQAFPHK